jgi:hypothetical protein
VIKRSDGELPAAMLFLALIAYPESSREEEKLRARALLAMQAWCERQARAAGYAINGTAIKALRVEHQTNTLRRLSTRLQKRLEAGRTGAMLLLKVRRPGKLGAPYNVSDFAEASGNRSKFLSVLWQPEVLPMCLVFHAVRLRWRDPRGFGVRRLLANPAWAIPALEAVEHWGQALPHLINLPLTLQRSVRTQFVRIELID